MTDLLEKALTAHGGLQRWRQIDRLKARVSVSGIMFGMKGKPDPYREAEVIVERERPKTVYTPFSGAGRRGVFETSRVAVETLDGQLLEAREEPRKSFASHRRETQWDDLHLIYFTGYAMWNYL